MIGHTFTDMFGTYEVISEPRWSESLKALAVDVLTPEGWTITMAVEAIPTQKDTP